MILSIIFIHHQILGSLDGEMDDAHKANKVVRGLEAAFCRVPGARGDAKYALRMTKASNNCITFHCDGGYATSTSQIPLNDPSEYKGGKLCYFVNDQLALCPSYPWITCSASSQGPSWSHQSHGGNAQEFLHRRHQQRTWRQGCCRT